MLANVSAHTGVDIPSLTTPSRGSRAPPAVTHARLLTAALLRCTALASWTSIAAVLGGEAAHIGENNRRYKAVRAQQPKLAAELDQLLLGIESWHNPAATPPTTPHHQRMHDLASAIKSHATALLASSHGVDAARRASIACCQQMTDLTRDAIAAVHGIERVEPSEKQAKVRRHRQLDRDFDQRYRQLLDQAAELQREAGYSDASLRRGLATFGRARASRQTFSSCHKHNFTERRQRLGARAVPEAQRSNGPDQLQRPLPRRDERVRRALSDRSWGARPARRPRVPTRPAAVRLHPRMRLLAAGGRRGDHAAASS